MSQSRLPKYFFLISIIIVSLFASNQTVLAIDHTSVGPQCDPPFNPSSTAADQTCPYCPSLLGPTEVHLKWSIGGFSNPTCTLSCSRPTGSVRGCSSYIYKDGNSYVTSTLGVGFKPIDDVYLIPSREDIGNVYQVSCRDGTSDTVKKSQKMKIAGCGGMENCEVPFSTIISSLNSGSKAVITESDFADWVLSTGGLDLVNWPTNNLNNGLGSGEMADIKKAIEVNQSCQVINTTEPTSHFIDPYSIIPKLIEQLNRYIPTRLGYALNGGEHGVIALGISLKKIEDFNNLKMGEPFIIEVFDSSPLFGFDQISCWKENREISGLSRFLIVCSSENYSYQQGGFLLFRGNATAPYVSCDESVRVRPKPTEWIKANNFPLSNWTDPSNPIAVQGVCFGISDFITKVACFGDFVGYDYHPDDGKIVDQDCDANHYPITKKSSLTDPINWLANLWLLLTK